MLRIWSPNANDKFATTASMAGIGYAFVPRITRKEDIAFRARLYWATQRDLEVIDDVQVDAGFPLPGHLGTYQYGYTFQRKMAIKPGTYLLRIECLDVTDEPPKVLASASRFVSVVK